MWLITSSQPALFLIIKGLYKINQKQYDAATLHYLEKAYPIWKPKSKIAQGKRNGGKCPW